MWTDGADRRTESRLRGIEGVTDIKGVYDVWDVEIDGTDRRIRQIQGITGSDILEWWDFPVHGGRPEELLDSLEERRSLVLSVKTGRLLDVKAGDSLTLMLGQPPRPRTYRVTGFFSSPDDSGGYALAGARWLKTDTGRRAYGDIWIKAPGRAGEVKVDIEKMYRNRPLWVTTMPELAEVNAKEMRQIFLMLQFFSLLAVLIASVGIVNNYLVSYIERRRILAVIRSTGMSRAQASSMLMVEAFTGGFIGALIGLAGGLAVASFLPAYMNAFDLSITLVISPVRMVFLMALGTLLSLGAQVIPSYRSRTLNLVEALKYE
jgi:putative ABC transport system permease protein